MSLHNPVPLIFHILNINLNLINLLNLNLWVPTANLLDNLIPILFRFFILFPGLHQIFHHLIIDILILLKIQLVLILEIFGKFLNIFGALVLLEVLELVLEVLEVLLDCCELTGEGSLFFPGWLHWNSVDFWELTEIRYMIDFCHVEVIGSWALCWLSVFFIVICHFLIQLPEYVIILFDNLSLFMHILHPNFIDQDILLTDLFL